jgi:hypothetical protein
VAISAAAARNATANLGALSRNPIKTVSAAAPKVCASLKVKSGSWEVAVRFSATISPQIRYARAFGSSCKAASAAASVRTPAARSMVLAV